MLNHFDESGQAVMVDVHGKDDTFRTATACGRIHMCDTAFAQIREGGAKKGDVLGVARIAGIMAANLGADSAMPQHSACQLLC